MWKAVLCILGIAVVLIIKWEIIYYKWRKKYETDK